MSLVITTPDVMAAAATDLAGIGSTISAANAAAAAPTNWVLAAAEDEVSAAITSLFNAHGRGFQALSAQAAAFHAQFVQALNGGGGCVCGRGGGWGVAVGGGGGGRPELGGVFAGDGLDRAPAGRQRRQRGAGDRG